MSDKTSKKLCLFILILFLFGCESHDSDYVPYTLKGMDVWVYDNSNSAEYYGGRVDASYFSKDDALSTCSSIAYSVAREKNLNDWGYVCCTVTSSSSCVTKVR